MSSMKAKAIAGLTIKKAQAAFLLREQIKGASHGLFVLDKEFDIGFNLTLRIDAHTIVLCGVELE